MKLQDDFTTLNWVKSELDETLKQARQALEAYVDDPSDTSLMRFCANYLHQVQGTLRMVELYGAAMVVEEMERLAEALLDGRVKQRDDAYSVLMRGMVQLPDYLERVQSGHKDIPIVLLPMLNDLRTCRGENLLSESVLFSPDLGATMPAAAAGVAQPLPVEIQRAHALKVRTAFQVALLKWLREDAPVPAAARLREVLDHLRSISFNEESRRLFWVAAGVADALLDGALESSATVKLLFGRVDRAIRMFADAGEQALQDESPRELVKNLLYYVAHSTSHSARVDEIRTTYRLGSLLPTEQEVDHAKGSISGHNRTLLDTVSVAIKDDLLRVKEALDIFLRAQQREPTDLLAQVELLDRVRDTLGMLGLGAPRRVVTEQREIIEEIASGRRGDDEGTLLDVAGALLYVEASLDDHIDRLGAPGADESGSDDEVDGMRPLPKAEVRKLLDALMREAEVNIQQAKHDVIAFVESPWDHDRVVHIPALLDEIAGALRMLDLSLAAELMIGIVRFVEVELLRHRRVPTAEQMDHLADALASIEYFLEATREQRTGRERILDVTCASLGDLGYWPVPDITDDVEVDQSSPVAAESSHDSALATAAALPQAGQAAADVFGFEAPPGDAAELSASDFPQWGEHLPMGSSESLQPEAAIEGDADVLESPEMSAFVDSDLELTDSSDTEVDDVVAEPVELTSAVDVAPGLDLHDLIVGDATVPTAHEQDLAGLKLVETTHDQEAAPAESEWIDVEEEFEEDVDANSAAEGDFGFGASEIDDEIREIFLEEVEEEIDGLRNQLPHWRAQPDNMEHVTSIRRSFHTLKGSGRLVGATALGEFSFKIESLLNSVLDRSISASPQVVGLVEHAINTLPQFQAALQDQGTPTANLEGIVDTAAKLSAGELLWLPERQAGKRTVKRIVRKRVPVASVAIANADISPAFKSPTPEIVAGPLPGLDPVLFEILKSEVAQHLESIDGFLNEAKASPQVVSKPVLRAVHTLNGAIAMVEIPVLVNVLAPLENLVKRLRAQMQPIHEPAIAVLDDSVALIRDVMLRLDHGSADLPDSNELAHRVETLRDELPEPVSAFAIYNDDEPSDAAMDASDLGDADALFTELSAQGDFTEDGSMESASVLLETTLDSPTEESDSLDLPASHGTDSIDLPAVDLTAALIGGFEDADDLADSVQALESDISDESPAASVTSEGELPSVDLSQAWQEQAETAADGFGTADDYAALFAEATAAMDALPQQASELAHDLELAADSVADPAGLDTLAASIDAMSVDTVSDWMTPAASADEIADAAMEVVEAKRIEAERIEAERIEAEHVEAERIEAERIEAEHVEAERIEAERIEAERIEAERIEA
ncbi:MAG: Hpt domain-containing protein, partial [Dokdonella sp.]